MSSKYNAFRARLVMGSLTRLQTIDKFNNNAELPENKQHWFVAFAVPKADFAAIKAVMDAEVNGHPEGRKNFNKAGFSWKYEDADAPENPENLGKAQWPAGHMIIKFKHFKSIGPVKVYDKNRQEMKFIDNLKLGDYFYVAGGCHYNENTSNPGLYQNLDGLMFDCEGEEIVAEGGFNADTAFAGIGGGITPTPTPTPTAATQPSFVPPANPEILTPPVAVDPYTDKGKAAGLSDATKPQWVAKGWTEQMMKDQGYMV